MSADHSLSSGRLEKLHRLEEKYRRAGQDLDSHLDGLLHADFLNYWDYIRLESLLSLQNPRTSLPDENAFILFHQISELYFKLCLLEFDQISRETDLSAEWMIRRVLRIVGYLRNLTHSFEVISEGMDPGQFMKFRMALLPASGFQSVQYRMIEISATDFVNLVVPEKRDAWKGRNPTDIQGMYSDLYWRSGAAQPSEDTVPTTLRQFDGKYAGKLVELAQAKVHHNLWQCYRRLDASGSATGPLRQALRQLDTYANLHWPLAHYRSAVRHLQQDGRATVSTGGTHWQQYLPPRFQKRLFYPGLWTEQEQLEWGKEWVEERLNSSPQTTSGA